MSEVTDRKLHLDAETEHALMNRLSRLEGQVRGIKRMVTERQACEDVLVQVAALRQAVTAVAVQLLEAHAERCVTRCAQTGDGRSALASLRAALSRVIKHA